MRIAYVHGYDGVTGAMLLGALLDAGASLAAVQEGWRQLQLPAARIRQEHVTGSAAAATCVCDTAWHIQPWLADQTYATLVAGIEQSAVAPGVKQGLLRMLQRFATAMAGAHGVADGSALAMRSEFMPDVLYFGSGVALALDMLGVTQVVAAPLVLGGGTLETTHGRVPVPRPLTTALCQGIPVLGCGLDGELTTVSGATILTALALDFGPLPRMTVVSAHYGATETSATLPGRQLQVVLGDVEGAPASERIAVIEANIDDMNPEFYESIFARLFAEGALDVTLTPLFMKKNRPGNTLTVLSPLPAVSRLAQTMLCETSTFGVRISEVWRQKLERFHRSVDTCYGVIPVKCGVMDGRMVQAAPEYEACKSAALEQRVPVRLVYTEAARLAAAWLV